MVTAEPIERTAERAADLPAIAEILRRIAGAEPDVDEDARAIHAATDAGPRAVAQLAEALAAQNIPVDDLGLRRPTLDEVFLTLTGQPTSDGEGD